jgi:tetratricopeptide (TPR) repeat protein
MNNRKLFLLVLCASLLLAGSWVVRGRVSGQGLLDIVFGPNEPPAPNTMPPAQQIAFWSGRLRPNTKDYVTLTHLGRSYLMQGRETGDAAAYARAEEALRRALELNGRYEPARALLGSALISNHAFGEALSAAQAALADAPDSLQGLAALGDAHLELGGYAAAEDAYRRLLDAAPGGPAYSRMSRLVWLQGRPDEAIDWMRRAADEAVQLDLGGEELAWYRFQLGELYFNTGDLRQAGKWYKEADEAMPGYYLALAGRGKVAAARGDLDEAIADYAMLVERLPQPGFVSFLGDLYALRGDADTARAQYDTVSFIHELDERQGVLYNRYMALFFANHNTQLDKALAYAQDELAARQDIYAYDTLAWVLYRLGRLEEARAASDKALALGTQDAALFYHAGMIRAAQGDNTAAVDFLGRALELNPHFDLLQVEVARETLASLAE